MKKVVSMLLALALLMMVLPMNLVADAAVTSVTLSAGDSFRQSWSEEGSMVADITVMESGFYSFTFSDHKRLGFHTFVLYDRETEEYLMGDVAFVYDRSSQKMIYLPIFTSKEIWLAAGRVYQLYLDYYDENWELLAGDATITLNKMTCQTREIPIGYSSVTATLGQRNEWFTVTPTVTADYNLQYSPTDEDINVDVFDMATGRCVVQANSWVYDSTTQSGIYKGKLVLPLQANTTYLLRVNAYEQIPALKLSIRQSTKTVKSIGVKRAIMNFTSFLNPTDIDEFSFKYEVTYTDNTKETLSCSDLWKKGYEAPCVYYVGETIKTQESTYLDKGAQPVKIVWHDKTATTHIQVTSFVDHLSDQPVTAENAWSKIEYISGDNRKIFARIKMSQSGMYALTTRITSALDNYLDWYEITIFDNRNRPIYFDAATNTWPLKVGEEYALCIAYTYKEGVTRGIDFRFQKQADTLFGTEGWNFRNGNWYYFRNGTMLKNTWQQDSKGWCHLGADGAMKTNAWVKDSHGWCYVGKDGYIVKSNWVKDGGKWYYLDKNGYMLANTWQLDSVGWCYLGADGAMKTNSWIMDSVGWCYVGADGYCITNNWVKDSVGWVYLDSNGRMLTNSWVQDSVGWCYVGGDGYAVTKTWKKDSVGWCYLNANGSMMKNEWLYDGGVWYYLDSNGYMVTGTRTIGGKTYTFNASGVCVAK